MRKTDLHTRTLMDLLVALGTIVAMMKRHGGSALLWLDTLNDNNLIQRCLDHGDCATNGAYVSFGSLLQGAAWQQIRAFIEWLGLGIEAAHWISTIMDALALFLVYKISQRLTNLWTALISVVLMLLLVDKTDRFADILWNYSPLLVVGSIVTALGIMIYKTKDFSSALLGGAVVSLGSNIHLICTLLLPGLVASALVRKEKKAAGVLGILLGFIATSLLSSAEAWFFNFNSLFGGNLIPASNMVLHQASVTSYPFVAGLAGLSSALLLSTLNKGAKRKLGIILFALVSPSLVLFIFGSAVIGLVKTNRYLLAFLPAVSLSVCVCGTMLVGESIKNLLKHNNILKKLSFFPAVATILVLVFIPPPTYDYDTQELRFSHVQTMAGELKNLGWTFEEVMKGIKGPKDFLLLDALRNELTAIPTNTTEGTKKPTNRTFENLVILRAPENLSEPLPTGCRLIPDSNGDLLVVKTETYLNWESFEVCWMRQYSNGDSNDWTCQKTGLSSQFSKSPDVCFMLKGFPDLPLSTPTRLRLQIPIKCHGNQSAMIILMPRFAGVCNGKITSVPVGSTLDKYGKEAQIMCRDSEDDHLNLVIDYNLASELCPSYDYNGFPPFFFEVGPDQAQFIKQHFNLQNKSRQP